MLYVTEVIANSFGYYPFHCLHIVTANHTSLNIHELIIIGPDCTWLVQLEARLLGSSAPATRYSDRSDMASSVSAAVMGQTLSSFQVTGSNSP